MFPLKMDNVVVSIMGFESSQMFGINWAKAGQNWFIILTFVECAKSCKIRFAG